MTSPPAFRASNKADAPSDREVLLDAVVTITDLSWEDAEWFIDTAFIMDYDDLYAFGMMPMSQAVQQPIWKQVRGSPRLAALLRALIRIRAFVYFVGVDCRIDVETPGQDVNRRWERVKPLMREGPLKRARAFIKERDGPWIEELLKLGEPIHAASRDAVTPKRSNQWKSRESAPPDKPVESAQASVTTASTTETDDSSDTMIPPRNSYSPFTPHPLLNRQVNDPAYRDQQMRESLASEHFRPFSSVRSGRTLATKTERRYASAPKQTWDGRQETWQAYKAVVRSWLYLSNMSYVVDPEFVQAYRHESFARALEHAPDMSHEQLKLDQEALCGILIQGLRTVPEKAVLLDKYRGDGISGWYELVDRGDTGPSVATYIGTLRRDMNTPYSSRQHGGIAGYLDKMEGLFALYNQTITLQVGSGLKPLPDAEKVQTMRDGLGSSEDAHAFAEFFRSIEGKEIKADYFIEEARKIALTVDLRLSRTHRQARTVTSMPATSSPSSQSTDPENADLYEAVRAALQSDPYTRALVMSSVIPSKDRYGEFYIPQGILEICKQNIPGFLNLIQEPRRAAMEAAGLVPPPSKETKAAKPKTSESPSREPLPAQYPNLHQTRANVSTSETVEAETTEDSDSDDESTINDMVVQQLVGELRESRALASISISLHVQNVAVNLARGGFTFTISDSGADTWVVGEGWTILHRFERYTNLVGFDQQVARKQNLPYVNAATVLRTATGDKILAVVHHAVYNKGSSMTLASEYQTREGGNVVDSVANRHKHRNGEQGGQCVILCQGEAGAMPEAVIKGSIHQALMVWGHRAPNPDELENLPRYHLTSKHQWEPERFFDSGEVIHAMNTHEQQAYEPGLPFVDPSPPPVPVQGFATMSWSSRLALMRLADADPFPEAGMPSTGSTPTLVAREREEHDRRMQGCTLPTSPPSVIEVPCGIFGAGGVLPLKLGDDDSSTENSDRMGVFFGMDRLLQSQDPGERFVIYDDDDTAVHTLQPMTQGGGNKLAIELSPKTVSKILEMACEAHGSRSPRKAMAVRTNITALDAAALQPYLGFRSIEIIRKTLENTTQLAVAECRENMRLHRASRNPGLNRRRLDETVSTDTIFSNTVDVSGARCAQVFYGLVSHITTIYGMRSESEGPDRLEDFAREEGIPNIIRSDNARMQRYGRAWVRRLREWVCGAEFSEPHNQQQNPVELRAVRWLKDSAKTLQRRTGAPPTVWFYAMKYIAEIHNITSDETLGFRTPWSMRYGTTPDISAYLMFTFYERVYFMDVEGTFPSTKEKSGRWLGVAKHVGDGLCFEILTDEGRILERSVVRSALEKPNMALEALAAAHPTPFTMEQKHAELEFSDSPLPIEGKPPPKLKAPERKQRVGWTDLVEEGKTKTDDIVHALNDEHSASTDSILDKLTKVVDDRDNFGLSALFQESDEATAEGSDQGEVSQQGENHGTNGWIPEGSAPPPVVTRSRRNIRRPQRYAHHAATEATVVDRFIPPTAKAFRLHGINARMPVESVVEDVHQAAKIEESIHTDTPDYESVSTTSRSQLRYVQACDAVMDPIMDPIDHLIWTPKAIMNHRVYKWKGERRVLFKVMWEMGDTTWQRAAAFETAHPTLVIEYACKRKGLENHPDFRWTKEQSVDKATFKTTVKRIVKAYKASVEYGTPKYKFGIEVPRDVRHALLLDKKNGNTLWQDALNTELGQINAFSVFRLVTDVSELEGFTRIPYHFVFDVKVDGRRKARLVAGGNHTNPTREDIYSGVVSIEAVRLGFLLAELNDLLVCAADVGNAFLYGSTKEKCYVKAGLEFGEELNGKWLVIDKGLYGLRSSSARFHEHLSGTLKAMGYKPSKADPDLWFKDCDDHYEYIARYVDDLLVFSKDPMTVMNVIKETYQLKGVGTPNYYLGGDVVQLDPVWNEENVRTGLSAKTYITNVVEKFEKLTGSLRTYKVPMDPLYHPEADESELLSPHDVSLYRGYIGSANWMITLGRFDIAYAVASLARYNAAPREGHLKAVRQVFGYVKRFPHGQIVIDASDHKVNQAEETVDQDWGEHYPDAEEDIPDDAPPPKGKPIHITVYKDANHGHDIVSRRSVTGVLMVMNQTPVTAISKRQKTVETSTYGSELVAARIAVELIIAYRYKLRMLGVPIIGPSTLCGDNRSVILNTTVPSSQLKKKHNAIAYHRIREAIAAKIVRFVKVSSENNYADVLTKPLAKTAFHRLIQRWLFRKPLHGGADQGEDEGVSNGASSGSKEKKIS